MDVAGEDGNATLATLWGRRKIEALQDSLVFGADPLQMKAEVTRVALDYGLLTPHTSLVAVDRTPVRLQNEALARGQVPSLLPAGSTTSVAGFPATATSCSSTTPRTRSCAACASCMHARAACVALLPLAEGGE